jgi:RND superfamily putative drug exporter
MFYRLGQFVHDCRWAVIAAWIIAAIVLRSAAPGWSSVAIDGDLDQLPPDATTFRASRLNAEAFPADRAKSQLVLVFARADGPLSSTADLPFAIATARGLSALPNFPMVGEPWTETTPVVGEMLKSPGGSATRVVANLSNDFMAVDNMRVLDEVRRYIDERRSELPRGLEIGITGSAAIGGDMLAAAAKSLRNIDRTTMILVAVALWLIYRSPWLVLVPLVAISVAAVISLELLAILAERTLQTPDAWPTVRVFTTTRIFIVVLLFGAGTDFCLFLIARFRELRGEGATQREAVAMALSRVGGTISASAFTTIVGLTMMGLADFGKFAYSGPASAMSLAVALAVCLTLAPAILSTWIGSRVGGRMAAPGDDGATAAFYVPWKGFWTRLAHIVVSRPAYVLEISLLIALPLAWYGWRAPVTFDILSELSPRSVSRRGTDLLMRHFPPGEVGPLVILAQRRDGGLAEDEFSIAPLHALLYALPGVADVRDLYRSMGGAEGATNMTPGGFLERVAGNSPLAQETFVAQLPGGRGEVTRLFVILDDPPFSANAVATVDRIDRALADLRADPDSPWRDATFEFMGPTAAIRDLERVTLADRRRIEGLVTAAVFGVILALLRSPLVCAYLVLSVLGSYLVTLGAVRLIFETIYGPTYPGLDWKAPIFLFVILVAVGQDYNIYLVTRVFEEQRRLGPLAGLRRALVQTGGIITSCGVIMAVTFGSMITGSLRGMVEIGVALSLGILLDTFVVRTIVVPAFLALVGRRGL